MSRGSQLAIGAVSGLLGLAVLASALVMRGNTDGPGPNPNVMFLLSGIALCISIACFFRSSRVVTMRLIGLALLAAGVKGLVYSTQDPVNNVSVRGYLFMASLAAGGLYLALTGKYPRWGAHGAILATMEDENQRKLNEPSSE